MLSTQTHWVFAADAGVNFRFYGESTRESRVSMPGVVVTLLLVAVRSAMTDSVAPTDGIADPIGDGACRPSCDSIELSSYR